MNSLILLCSLLCFGKVLQYLYRLISHPLSNFPGPRLAAVTNLYGAYYDLFGPKGFVKKFPELHDQSGPIIRIFPDQLQIRDIEAYDQIFKIGTKFDKYAPFYSSPSVSGSHLNITALKPAKQRKDMFQSYFSKASIERLEPTIVSKVSRLVNLMCEAADRNEIVNLAYAYRCLTIDNIADYCFGRPLGALEAKNFTYPLAHALLILASMGRFEKYFPKTLQTISTLMLKLPRSVVARLSPELGSVRAFEDELKDQVLHLKKTRKHLDASAVPTIFDTMLNPNEEKGQYTPSNHDLAAESVLMCGAGTDTTANCLSTGTWYLLNDQHALYKLKTELLEALPQRDSQANLTTLERLPYLGAVVKESLRLFYGAPGRLPRVVPPTGAVLCGQQIPPGTVVSCCHYVYHHDESVFKDSFIFSPERWLRDDAKQLEHHLLSFSHGSRSCLGMNLALAELYLTFAYVFRRLDLSLYETTAADMEWTDNHVLVFNGNVKVQVKEVDE